MVELNTLKLRLQHGREAKAKRGELGRCLAPGYVRDPLGHFVKDPNLRVQQAMALVFSKFAELASVRQTHRWFHEERIELPVNKARGARSARRPGIVERVAALRTVRAQVAHSLLG